MNPSLCLRMELHMNSFALPKDGVTHEPFALPKDGVTHEPFALPKDGVTHELLRSA